MHVRPYVVLGLAGVCAGAGLGVIVANTDPTKAAPAIMYLAGTALFLTIWSLMSAIASLCRVRLGAALAVGLLWAFAISGLAWSGHNYGWSWKLPAIAIGATILVSFAIWRLDKRTRKDA